MCGGLKHESRTVDMRLFTRQRHASVSCGGFSESLSQFLLNQPRRCIKRPEVIALNRSKATCAIITRPFFIDRLGVSELVRVVIQCGHLVGDTIVQGSATSHMVPVDQADGKDARERLWF